MPCATLSTVLYESANVVIVVRLATVDIVKLATVDIEVSLDIVKFARKLTTSTAGQKSVGAGGKRVFLTAPFVVICPIAMMKVTMADRTVPQNAPLN